MKRALLALIPLSLASQAMAIPFNGDLLYHLDPTSVVVDGSNNVSQWTDLSGNGHNFTQANAALRPSALGATINGINTVNFGGAEELVLSVATSPRTFIAVTRVNTGGGLRGIWGDENGDKGVRLDSTTFYRSAGHNTDGNDFANGDPAGVRVNGGVTGAYTVGAAHIIDEVRGPALTGGGNFNDTSAGQYFGGRDYLGDVAEIAVYDRVLSRKERYQVEQFLAAKYGLSLAVQNGSPLTALRGNDLTDLGNNGNEAVYNGVNLGGFDAVFFGNNEAFFNGAEGSFNVFDNLKGAGANKWCCDSADRTGGIFVGADFTSLLASDSKGYVLDSFTLSSDNDSGINRDPDVWAIEGSDDGVTWTTIYSYNKPGDSIFDNFSGVGPDNLTVEFEAGLDYAKPAAFKMFRYHAFSSVNNANHAISEIEFFGRQVLVPEPATLGLAGLGALALFRRRRSA